jgi:hypothetical protein
VPRPGRFDPGSVRRWWQDTAIVLRTWPREELPLPRADEQPWHTPEPRPAPHERIERRLPDEPEDGPEDGKEPDDTARPAPEPPEPVPPAPGALAAKPDLDAVVLTWRPIAWGKGAVAEYGIYRRAPGDTEFTLAGRFPVPEENIQKYIFLDEGVSLGTEYEYAVAAFVKGEDGEPVEGELCRPVTASAGFRIYYTGGDGERWANVVVEKMYGGELRRASFRVQKRDLSRGETGEIGGPKLIKVVPKALPDVEQRVRVDFSTGYFLVDFEELTGGPAAAAKPRTKIIIKNNLGLRREIPQSRAPGG